MGQKFREDKIGSLSHSTGVITLQASRLTIGGQQYTTPALGLTLPALTANTLYMLYVVVNAGVLSLIQSTNVNSVGPAGQTAWKLVGAYMANETPAWGSFLNIEGVPKTYTNITYTPIQTGLGTLGSPNFNFQRDGRWMICDFRFTTGTVVGSLATLGLPVNLQVDPNIYPQTSYYLGNVQNNSNVGVTSMNVFRLVDPSKIHLTPVNQNGNGILGNTSPLASGQIESGQWRVAISTWTDTPLKDL